MCSFVVVVCFFAQQSTRVSNKKLKELLLLLRGVNRLCPSDELFVTTKIDQFKKDLEEAAKNKKEGSAVIRSQSRKNDRLRFVARKETNIVVSVSNLVSKN